MFTGKIQLYDMSWDHEESHDYAAKQTDVVKQATALLDKMQTELAKNGYRFSTIFDIVVSSPQFRNQRCRNFSAARFRLESQGD